MGLEKMVDNGGQSCLVVFKSEWTRVAPHNIRKEGITSGLFERMRHPSKTSNVMRYIRFERAVLLP
jgi:hypothetical protein